MTKYKFFYDGWWHKIVKYQVFFGVSCGKKVVPRPLSFLFIGFVDPRGWGISGGGHILVLGLMFGLDSGFWPPWKSCFVWLVWINFPCVIRTFFPHLVTVLSFNKCIRMFCTSWHEEFKDLNPSTNSQALILENSSVKTMLPQTTSSKGPSWKSGQ